MSAKRARTYIERTVVRVRWQALAASAASPGKRGRHGPHAARASHGARGRPGSGEHTKRNAS